MTTFIALQPATGQEIARLECRDLQQACSKMNGLRLTGGAGYIVHGGRIVASIPCRDVGHSIPDYSATDRAIKRLVKQIINDP